MPGALAARVFGIDRVKVGVQQPGVFDEDPQQPLAASRGPGGRHVTGFAGCFVCLAVAIVGGERKLDGVGVGELQQRVPVDLEPGAHPGAILFPLPEQRFVGCAADKDAEPGEAVQTADERLARGDQRSSEQPDECVLRIGTCCHGSG